ncbi:MAG: iron-containing redox enzyme family protein [Acidimicrobiia bacterium]
MRDSSPHCPRPRGVLSEALLAHLRRGTALPRCPSIADDPLGDDDLQLALYVAYELHYRGFRDVDQSLEWSPEVLRFRRALETSFVDRLRDELGPSPGGEVVEVLPAVIESAGGPSLSAFMLERGTVGQFREFAVHRSPYQLKEADPHTWAIPRLTGEAKAALVEIQADEYGRGRSVDMHATLFATTMRSLGLDDTYGAYLDHVPGTTLATVNLVTLFGLHRRWRGALVGHLAVFEMTSVTPMGRYSRALRRLGVDAQARRFYDVHVVADAEHEVIALCRMAGELARQEPSTAADIVFGARAVTEIERRFAVAILDAWAQGSNSLRRPLRPGQVLPVAS